LEEWAAYFNPEDGDSMLLQNVGALPQDYTANNPEGLNINISKEARMKN
jgi:hypothetical protein